ncbi:hypothetical protein Lesp02_38720 [Lentzea sp. NBRC 105346]|uniref:hypothetical protein n=1 Tax=Lentzea sp. NBRC 105346 TaxID=3032205 RepID=UPI0024A39887|nr:hypothetical protein [Lentzea sp. NBRC 105346]GLZ31684.1 hypothetical protein Lesp02_38720 [Lentzea sp. NBRC 105346]
MVAFNGVDAHTGGYLFPRMGPSAVARLAQETDTKSAFLRGMRRRDMLNEATFGVLFVDDPDDLAQTGWGVLFPEDVSPEVVTALEPLLRLRERDAGRRFHRYFVRRGESVSDFLMRNGMGPGPADPNVVPYYLLIVGPPTAISFPFQYQLDVDYAVGRIDLDTPSEYAAYAEAVCVAEERAFSRPAVHLFGTRNAGDTATALSASRLVQPLADQLASRSSADVVSSDIGPVATKARLAGLLEDGPPVLFTATHGLGSEHGAIKEIQGSLVCQDWPGPLAVAREVDPAHYLSAADVVAPLATRIVFSFACYSAGYPDQPYVSSLPKKLLSLGLLGFVGHVDRAWGYSFLWKGAKAQITSMVGTMLDIHKGHRLGNAMEAMNSRWASIATQLATELDAARDDDKLIDDRMLAWLWTASNDARDYVVLGDPAVRA